MHSIYMEMQKGSHTSNPLNQYFGTIERQRISLPDMLILTFTLTFAIFGVGEFADRTGKKKHEATAVDFLPNWNLCQKFPSNDEISIQCPNKNPEKRF